MPSTPPSQSNKYRFEADTPLDPPTLSGIMESLDDRIAAQEALVVDYQTAIDNLNNLGLQVIAENLAPQIQAARDQLDALELQAIAVEDQIAALVATGLAATGVSLTAISGLAATNAQAAFAELVGDIDALATALGEIETDVAAAIAALKAGAVIVVNADVTAVAGDDLYVTTDGGVRTVTLPETPVAGNRVSIWRFGANNVVVARNGQTIAGLAEDLNIDTDKVIVTLRFLGGTWRVSGGSFA